MNMGVDGQFSRRDILRGSLLFGAAAALSGCQSAPPPLPSAAMPGPVWPDLPRPGEAPVATGQPAPAPAAPAPSRSNIQIIPRSEWTRARPIMTREAYSMNGVSRITVHHDAIYNADIQSTGDAARRLNSIRHGHIAEGWVDIGYHYVIDPSGRVWEARPTNLQGAHVKNNNEHNLGIMVMGNFEQQRPSSAAMGTLEVFLADQMRRYNVGVTRVYTHREIGQTSCPGRNLQSVMLSLRGRGGRLARA